MHMYSVYCILYCVYLLVIHVHIIQYTYVIDPLSEGLVTPPLRVEKLSPGLNFFDNMFSCIT